MAKTKTKEKAQTKAKIVKLPVPQNEAEATLLLGELERLKLQLDERQVELNQAVNALVVKASLEAEPISEAFAAKFTALKAYAVSNKDGLTENGKRGSVKWATGTLGWRQTPAGISVPRSKGEIERIIDRIKALGLKKFLREKLELNVEAMEASPLEATAIEGINARAASETFFVKFADNEEIKSRIKLKIPTKDTISD